MYKKYCLPHTLDWNLLNVTFSFVCYLTPGHCFSAQTRLLCWPLPAVHVQHCVQENPPYVPSTCVSQSPGSSRHSLIYLRSLHFQWNPHPRRRVAAEVREVSAGPPLWVVPPHCRTPQGSQAWTPNSSTTATLKAPSRTQRAVRPVLSFSRVCRCKPLLPAFVCRHWVQSCFGFLSLFSGVQSDRPDLVPRTPPPAENPADLSSSSLGDAAIDPNSPPLQYSTAPPHWHNT